MVSILRCLTRREPWVYAFCEIAVPGEIELFVSQGMKLLIRRDDVLWQRARTFRRKSLLIYQ
jgi:hypothetical protein